MTVDQQVILSFFESIEAREAEKKEIADDIKDSIETFAVNYEINKKGVVKAYKEWKAWKKDEAEYTEIDYTTDVLLVSAVPQMGTGDTE